MLVFPVAFCPVRQLPANLEQYSVIREANAPRHARHESTKRAFLSFATRLSPFAFLSRAKTKKVFASFPSKQNTQADTQRGGEKASVRATCERMDGKEMR